MQPPCTNHVVCEDEILLREVPDTKGVTSLHCDSVSAYQFCVCRLKQAVDFPNPYNRCNVDGVLNCGPGEDHDDECNVQD